MSDILHRPLTTPSTQSFHSKHRDIQNRIAQAGRKLEEARSLIEQINPVIGVDNQLSEKPKKLDPKTFGYINSVLHLVAKEYGVTKNDISSHRRQQNLTRARFTFIGIICETTGLSYPKIGYFLGGRDHSTVIHGHRKAKNLYETLPEFKKIYDDVMSMIDKPE